jgi:GH15 family glucan-1,4-alpha-glucosidase
VTDRPIADYALLSDCHTGALVSGDGSIDWLCVPRFDSPSVFARLLDPGAGHWSICPSGTFDTMRRYLPESLVLETRFMTPTGAMMLTDALVFDDDERGHEIGFDAPHVLTRVVEVTDGEVALDAEFALRPEYGGVSPRLQVVDGGVLVSGGATRLLLSGPEPTAFEGATAVWRLGLTAGQSVAFALQYASPGRPVPDAWSDRAIRKRLADTEAGWRSWSELHQRYEGAWRDAVHHSGRVLQALTYRPTGAIVAAATTSLPEEVAGSRNWDYRYAWVRDASITIQALWVAACPDEAGRFLSFLIGAAGTNPGRDGGLQIMYGVGGEHDLSERELAHLEGWRSSRPVRVGNAAWEQVQNDGYGALLDAAYRYRDNLGEEIEAGIAAVLIGVADAAAAMWTEPDQGIWELRGEPGHHLHSKLMCWVALDRAVRLADQLGAQGKAPEWDATADRIRHAILDQGWNEELGAYTQSFGSDRLDSSTLMLAITGFLLASDPRMRSTIEQVATQLSAPCGLLYRYLGDDGMDGNESPFLICSYWLAECWALAGELGAAQEIFERATAYANDVGLLSEEADPVTGELLGNYPQAFSHIGLVNAAWTISQAEADGPGATLRR